MRFFSFHPNARTKHLPKEIPFYYTCLWRINVCIFPSHLLFTVQLFSKTKLHAQIAKTARVMIFSDFYELREVTEQLKRTRDQRDTVCIRAKAPAVKVAETCKLEGSRRDDLQLQNKRENQGPSSALQGGQEVGGGGESARGTRLSRTMVREEVSCSMGGLKHRLEFHAGLEKAESSLAVQM